LSLGTSVFVVEFEGVVVLVAGVVLCNNLDFTLPDSNLPSDDSD
jgi:hypothetical protein